MKERNTNLERETIILLTLHSEKGKSEETDWYNEKKLGFSIQNCTSPLLKIPQLPIDLQHKDVILVSLLLHVTMEDY